MFSLQICFSWNTCRSYWIFKKCENFYPLGKSISSNIFVQPFLLDWLIEGFFDLCKGTVPPDFSPLVFFFKQLLLAPVDKPSNDLDFFRIFADIFDFSGVPWRYVHARSVNPFNFFLVSAFLSTRRGPCRSEVPSLARAAPGDHEPLIGGAPWQSMGVLRLGRSVTWSFCGWMFRQSTFSGASPVSMTPAKQTILVYLDASFELLMDAIEK